MPIQMPHWHIARAASYRNLCGSFQVRRKPLRTPLFIISTEGRDRDREKGLALGANEYLVKPFPPDELVRLCKKYLGTS